MSSSHPQPAQRKKDNHFHAARGLIRCIPIRAMDWSHISTKFSSAMSRHEHQTATPRSFGLDAILLEVADEFHQAVAELLRCLLHERKSGSQVQDFEPATESLISKNGLHHLDTATKP